MHPATVNVKQLGYVWGRVAVGAEQDSLQAQGHAGCFVGVGFLAQRQQLAADAGISVDENWFHSYVAIYMRILWEREIRRKKTFEKATFLKLVRTLHHDIMPIK